MRALLLTAVLAAAGCYSEEPDPVYASATVGDPALVEVSPGVDVIADADYPVFYNDGYWWRYDGGLWYSSAYYNRGWGVSYNVPYGIRGIRNPGAYSHWHNGPIVRDHRGGYTARGGTYGGYRGDYNGYRGYSGYRGTSVRAAPMARTAPAYRGGGGFHGGGGMRGGGGGFHGGGGGHGGHR
ncbi:MAG TPA: hypothetical protein VGC41_16640 [Kofleriaceae bacterium]